MSRITTGISNTLLPALFSGLLAYTAASKFFNTELFLTALQAIDFIHPYAPLLSIAIPVIEVILALLIIYARTRMIGLFAFLVYVLIVTGYLLTALVLSKNLPCTCVGLSSSLSWWQQLGVNLVLIVLVSLSIFATQRAVYRIAIQSRLLRPEQS